MPRPKPIELRTAPFGQTRDGELLVGAFARRQFRRRVLLGAGGTALIAVAVALFLTLSEYDGGDGVRHDSIVRCLQCRAESRVRVRLGDSYPLRCPACRALAALELWHCYDCGLDFVPPQSNDPVACPRCQSESLGSTAAARSAATTSQP